MRAKQEERSKPVTLNEVLAYDNQDVFDRYVLDSDAEVEQAKLLFEDVKRWLWLCAEARRDTAAGQDVPTPTIFEEQADLDEMWHTFILFTPAYVEFCFGMFDTYLHHEPTPERVKREYEASPVEKKQEGIAKRAALRRRVAGYLFDKLGPEVARRWYLAALSAKAA